MLRNAKDELSLKVHGVYQIPSECSKIYKKKTGRSIGARKEHMKHILNSLRRLQ
jgi:hypothetical protein